MSKTPNPLIEQLAAEHGRELQRFLARRVRPAAEARDLAQEVFVRLLRLSHTSLIRDPEAYLYRVAINLLSEFEIHRRAELLGQQRWKAELATEAQTERAAADAPPGLAARLGEVLKQLPEPHRAVLILHRQEGMTYDEIASRLEISPSTVKKYLQLALRHCRAQLRDVE